MPNNNFPPTIARQLAEMEERHRRNEKSIREIKKLNARGVACKLLSYVAAAVLFALDFSIGMLNHDSYRMQREISKRWLKHFFN